MKKIKILLVINSLFIFYCLISFTYSKYCFKYNISVLNGINNNCNKKVENIINNELNVNIINEDSNIDIKNSDVVDEINSINILK